MKNLILLLMLIVLTSGCHFGINHNVIGSGTRQIQKRDVPAFSSISTEGAFDIQVVCQKPQSLEIEADDNILPLISTDVSNKVLHIRSLRGYSNREPIMVKIAVENLDGVSASGAGKIDVSGVKNDKFEIDISGAPTVRVSGDTKVVNIDASGAGKVDAHKLHASRATVDSKGVSHVEVYAGEELNVTIAGPSHVTYDGDPVVNKTVHGPGSVEKRESSGS